MIGPVGFAETISTWTRSFAAAEPPPYSMPAASISASASRYQPRRQPEIDEAGACDLGALDLRQRRRLLDELLRDRPRRLPPRAGELHRHVRRVVAVRVVARPLEHDRCARRLAECRLQAFRSAAHAVTRTDVDEDDPGQERQLNIQIDEKHLAGTYANFANISFSDYEFTVTFARIDHEV